jgi:hypothetical protein
MDELVIDDKKYISSKRAAKLTGYAKDYIGQLCREGRVSARLVGRSWYVLESAIQDHRFGTQPQTEDNEPSVSATGKEEEKSEQETITSTWEMPKYEADTVEYLPSINRLRAISYPPLEAPSDVLQTQEREEVVREPSLSPENASITIDTQKVENTESHQIQPLESENETSEEAKNIPIHTIYDYELPPEGLLPEKRSIGTENEDKSNTSEYAPTKSKGRVASLALLLLLVLALSTLLYAVKNSGYLDRYTSSYEQVAKLFNIIVYIK